MEDPLINPVWSALTGPHAAFAERHGAAARYPDDLAPFVALADPSGWNDAAVLLGPGGGGAFTHIPSPVPAGWHVQHEFRVHQMLGDRVSARTFPEAVRLGSGDVPEMLDLIERTDPGPFRKRTVELGIYLGVRRDGRLIAMAGERLHPAGHAEISAVCTDPSYRGQGLAGRLVCAVAAVISERGERPFLHVSATNKNAIRLYEQLGFRLTDTKTFLVLVAPRVLP